MKIEIQYLHVVGKSSPEAKDPSYYEPFHKRFYETYERFNAGVDHDLHVVFCGNGADWNGAPPVCLSLFAKNNVLPRFYNGPGWDIGAHQAVALESKADLVLCLATPVYFKENDWLTPIVDAWQRYGDGLYGPMASYENMPHIRTSAYAFSPDMLRKYPWKINSREECFHFESGFDSNGKLYQNGEKSFTNWMIKQAKPVLMVTRNGCYTRENWRGPANIFRRGDQSNCLVWDRHCDIYEAANQEGKQRLEALADSWNG